MKTLCVLCVALLLSACNESGSTAAQSETVPETPFQVWASTTPIAIALDFSAAAVGTSSVGLTLSNETCTCVADIAGTDTQGSADVHTCTHVSGSGNACTGAASPSFGTVDYILVNGATQVWLTLPAVTNPIQLFN